MSHTRKSIFNRKTGFITAFLLPGVLLFAAIYAYPLFTIFKTSFTSWNYQNLNSPTFLGFSNMFDNYIKLFTTDYYFIPALIHTLCWVGITLLVQVPLAIIVALVLYTKPYGWKVARNAFIIPNIISTAAIGLIFLNMYDPSRGVVRAIIKMFDKTASINITANSTQAFWGVTFAYILFAGSSMILVLSQIFAISEELFEAAKIDGARDFQVNLYIVLPLLRPIIGTITILAANYALLLYNEISFITSGGPDNATYSISYYIYQKALGNTKLNFAMANTAGVIQFIMGILIVSFIGKMFRTSESDI